MMKFHLLPMLHSEPSCGGLRRVAWQAVGSGALLLGTLGVALPLLPTTPFVILAAFAFARSSPAMHDWLLRSRIFGPIIADWHTNGAIALRYKGLALGMMGGALGLSVAMALSPFVLAVQTICIMAAAIFILSRPNRAA